MTSAEFFNKSALEEDEILLEIWEPDPIVLPIPENGFGATTPVRIGVLITNKTQSLFLFVYGVLTPELVGADGSALRPHKLVASQTSSGQYYGIGIPPTPTTALARFLTAQLDWQNNCLQLQGSICSSPDENYLNLENEFSLSPLHQGTYKLRFTYKSPSAEFCFFDRHLMKSNKVEEINSEILSTRLANIIVVEPVGANKSAVEVDGIKFETAMPERILKASPNQDNKQIPVQIGMKIANNTSRAFRFCSSNTLTTELIGENGRITPQGCGGSLAWTNVREDHFYLARPGESVALFPKAYLVWQPNELLSLTVAGGSRACWRFNDLSPGKYRIHLTYRALTEPSEILFEDLWVGKVSTPSVEFDIVRF